MNKKYIFFIIFSLAATQFSWTVESELSPEKITAFNEKQAKFVRKLYGKWYGSVLHYILTKGKWPSTFSGIWANSRISKRHIPRFIKKYSISVNEIEKPVSSFKTFNEFFTRKLKEGARPIPDSPNTIISPADGTLRVIPNISKQTPFSIKETPFTLQKMVRDEKIAQQFEGGTAFIIRLAPWDYHRLHFPITGTPSVPRKFRGRYESVHPFVYLSGVQPLDVNERHLILHDTQTVSTVALILVGALFVGTIVETYIPDKEQKKGQEIGHFKFGGSTIVMLFQPNKIDVLPEILKNSKEGKETVVRVGQIIAHVKNQQ